MIEIFITKVQVKLITRYMFDIFSLTQIQVLCVDHQLGNADLSPTDLVFLLAEPEQAGEHPAAQGGAPIPELRPELPRGNLPEGRPLRHHRLPSQGRAGASSHQGFSQVLQRKHYPVLRIRNVYPESVFFHYGSRIRIFSIPDSHQRI